MNKRLYEIMKLQLGKFEIEYSLTTNKEHRGTIKAVIVDLKIGIEKYEKWNFERKHNEKTVPRSSYNPY